MGTTINVNQGNSSKGFRVASTPPISSPVDAFLVTLWPKSTFARHYSEVEGLEFISIVDEDRTTSINFIGATVLDLISLKVQMRTLFGDREDPRDLVIRWGEQKVRILRLTPQMWKQWERDADLIAAL